MRIFADCFQRWFKVPVGSALAKPPIFYVGTGYFSRSDRRSGLNSRIAERPLVSAVEEVRLQFCSGFFDPWTCGIHWLSDGVVGKTSGAVAICLSVVFLG